MTFFDWADRHEIIVAFCLFALFCGIWDWLSNRWRRK